MNNILLSNRVDYSIERVDTTGRVAVRLESLRSGHARDVKRVWRVVPRAALRQAGYRLTSNLETDMAERITRKQH